MTFFGLNQSEGENGKSKSLDSKIFGLGIPQCRHNNRLELFSKRFRNSSDELVSSNGIMGGHELGVDHLVFVPLFIHGFIGL